MAEGFNPESLNPSTNPEGDVDMDEIAGGTGPVLPFAEGGESDPRTAFTSYLMSPIVTLIVGSGENETILTAHQGLLHQSPFFADACAAFANDGSVSLRPSILTFS
jgi:hypothetical protein